MKIACVSIALNEAKFAIRWAEACADADYRFVLDTGSTDDTLTILNDAGVHTHSATVRPFRFDDARTTASCMLPNDIDVVIWLDMDEVMTKDWRKNLERCWAAATTRLRYRYVWSWTAQNDPDLMYFADKIAGRFTHRWVGPVHEVLTPTVTEVYATCDDILIEHHPDSFKPRSQYLKLLELATHEDPHNDRNSHYLGREYFFNRMYAKALTELHRHLSLSSATWAAERAASMRYIAKCHEGLVQPLQAREWYIRANLEDPKSREALIDLARFSLQANEYYTTIGCCLLVKEMPTFTGEYLAERYARTEGADDLMAVAYWNIGDEAKAIRCAEKAVALNPHDERLKKNFSMMQEKINGKTLQLTNRH